MVIKKHPKGGGINWTQWFMPSLMARAIYRRFMPTPHHIDFPRQQRIVRRFAVAYFASAWTILCVLGYYAYHRSYVEGETNPSVEVRAQVQSRFTRFYFLVCQCNQQENATN